MISNLKKTFDEVSITCSVLKRLNASEIVKFDDRIKSQKVQYFAQIFGVSPIYSFNLYIRGPYSPDLAHDLYEVEKTGIKIPIEKFVSEEMEKRLSALREFLKEKTNRDLEIISTLHWLLKVVNLPKSLAELKLRELKNSTPEEEKLAFVALERIPA